MTEKSGGPPVPEPDDLAALVAELVRFEEAATRLTSVYMRSALLKAHEPYIPRILAALKQARERETEMVKVKRERDWAEQAQYPTENNRIIELERQEKRLRQTIAELRAEIEICSGSCRLPEQRTADLLARTAPPEGQK